MWTTLYTYLQSDESLLFDEDKKKCFAHSKMKIYSEQHSFIMPVSSWILCSKDMYNIYIVMQYVVYSQKMGFYLSSNKTKYDWTQNISLIGNSTENSYVTNQMENHKYKHIIFCYIQKTRPAFPYLKRNTNCSTWLWTCRNSVRFTSRRKIVNQISTHSIERKPWSSSLSVDKIQKPLSPRVENSILHGH